MARYLVMFGGALVALISGLAAFAALRVRGAKGPSVLGDLVGRGFDGLLLQIAFWVGLVALLVVIATALISLAHDTSRTDKVRRRPVAISPEAKPPPPSEHRAP